MGIDGIGHSEPMGIQRSGNIHPVSVIPPGQNISSAAQKVGQWFGQSSPFASGGPKKKANMSSVKF